MKIIKSALVYILFIGTLYSQDTLSLMSYNILNYSSIDANKGRYIDLRNIVKNANPDILMLCEIADSNAPQYLLDSALNKAGVGTYTRATFFDGPDTDNAMFYKKNKVKIKSQKQIATVLRDISQYLIYTEASNDSAFIYLHMSHLKAGSLASDESQRGTEANAFCIDIASIPQTENIIIAGDMNLKSSSEAAFVTLSSNACSHIFFDPINQLGLWNNNNAFSKLFTQSTRTSVYIGCCGASTGGLDDRFDLMLVTNSVLNGNNKVSYLPGSYKAYGNDNQHMNLSMLDGPTNTVVPTAVAQSLFNMSDHLPITMKVVLKPSVSGVKENLLNKADFKIWGVNEIGNSYLSIITSSEGLYNLHIIDIAGKEIKTEVLELKKGYQVFDIHKLNLENALYHIILNAKNSSTHCLFSKTSD